MPRPVGRAGPRSDAPAAAAASPPRRLRSRDRLRARATRLRLRGRFRGRRGLLAFLAVMGPGLIAGIAGNDAGGITTYSVMGATTGLTPAVAVPDHDRHPGDRPGDGGAARRGHRPGPVGPDPRPVRGPPRRPSRWSSCSSPTWPTRSPSSPARPPRSRSSASRAISSCRSSAIAIWALVIKASYRTVERVFLSVIVVFLAYIVSAILADPDWGAVGRALVTPSLDLDAGAAAAASSRSSARRSPRTCSST